MNEARREMAKREMAKRDPLAFAQYVDPNFVGYGMPHARLLFEQLRQAVDGSLWDGMVGSGPRILLISLPPGHYKTSITNKLTSWFVGNRKLFNKPHQIAMVSYSADLAESNSRTVRDTIDLPIFRNVFDGVTLDPNRRSVSRWALEGELFDTALAAGVGGPLTGHRAHLLMIDDPIKNPEQAYSAAERDRAWMWWNMVAKTRLTSESIVVIPHTRWHEDDLTGRLIALWREKPTTLRVKLLRLPALAEGDDERNEARALLGIDDGSDDLLGREENEALCPAILTTDELKAYREGDPHTFAALYQGIPRPLKGRMLGRGEFIKLMSPPVEGIIHWVISTDWAMTEKQTKNNNPDYTVAGLVGMWWPDKGNKREVRLIVGAGMACQLQLGDAETAVKNFAIQVENRLMQKPAIVGAVDTIDKIALNAIQDDPQFLTWPVENVSRKQLKGDKVVKSHGWRSRVSSGKVYWLDDSWWGKNWSNLFFSQIEAFPIGHDDYVDMMSVAVRYLELGHQRKVIAHQMEG